jgi:hypothetical protein
MWLSVLQNNQHYEKKNRRYDAKKVMNKLKTIINKNGQGLTAEETEYLFSFDIKTSNFYGLPKIHKTQMINGNVNIPLLHTSV